MLYQLSYLGAVGAGTLSPAPAAYQAAPGSGSSSSPSVPPSRPGTTYWPVIQRPKSTSAQRREQNGRSAATAGRWQMGQGISGTNILDQPVRLAQRGVAAQVQGMGGNMRQRRKGSGIGL